MLHRLGKLNVAVRIDKSDLATAKESSAKYRDVFVVGVCSDDVPIVEARGGGDTAATLPAASQGPA